MQATIADTPSILGLVQDAAPLDDLKATAAFLWFYHHGESFDPGHVLRDRVDAYWLARGGDGAYSEFLRKRGSCATCATTYKYENLSICPNCFSTYCPAHKAGCSCGHAPVG